MFVVHIDHHASHHDRTQLPLQTHTPLDKAGVIDVATDGVESAAEIAATIAEARRYVPANRLIACTNCGMAPMSWTLATAKLAALTQGARTAV
ncbi:MAG: hypothetical protein EXR86_04620 [Gammaproteobacteria bacterium]|nr:hypothetical protein [Gammaproteobacteria bacterium]